MASSATVSAPKKRKSFSEYFHSMRGQQLIVTLVFLFVPLVLLFMFTYLPFFKMVEFSFFKMKYIGRRTFVGLQNYISVFTRKDCFHALSLSLYYMVGSVVQMALALLFATILSFKCKGSKFFRGALYFPCLICGISVGFIFKFFFTHGFVLDTLLSWVGFNVDKLPFWLRDESINNVVLVACSIWKYIGQNIVMFIGAIASVDPVLYEAAEIDGANAWHRFKDIILPSISTIVVLNLIIGLAFGFITLLLLDPILYFFGASEATIGYARDYMSIILMGNVITHMYLGLNSVLRASGHPRKSMYATIYTVVINAALDPLFIYGFGWGIRGAAIATVLAQIIALIWQFHILSDKSELLHFRRGIYRLRRKIVRDILAIGMSPFLMNLAACFIVILINKGLKQYGGDLMIGAYGIVNRLAFFFVMIVMGINQGMQPIAGYNFGARQYDRVLRVLRLTIIGATCVTGAGFLMGELAPRLAVSAFTNDPELIRLAVEGMRIVFVCFPIIGFQMVATNFFMSIGMAGKAIFLSLSRQLLFLMPGLIFLPHIFDVHTRWDGSWGVWCAMPLSDLMASVVAFFMLVYQLRKFRAQMDAARSTNLQ